MFENTELNAASLFAQVESFKEIVAEKKVQTKAFCKSNLCFKGNNAYRVRKLGVAYEKKVKLNKSFCPDCDRALFWSSEYKK